MIAPCPAWNPLENLPWAAGTEAPPVSQPPDAPESKSRRDTDEIRGMICRTSPSHLTDSCQQKRQGVKWRQETDEMAVVGLSSEVANSGGADRLGLVGA